jgi:hypothetical protein
MPVLERELSVNVASLSAALNGFIMIDRALLRCRTGGDAYENETHLATGEGGIFTGKYDSSLLSFL